MLLVLAALASHGKAMSVRDLLAVTGLAQSTLYRQIALLKRWGFVAENAGHYAPGPISLQLALGFDVNSLLVEASRSEMQQLARASQESIGLVVAVKHQVMCLEMVDLVGIGRADAAVTGKPAAYQFVKTRSGFRVLDKQLTTEAYGIAVRKDEPQLKAAFNTALAKIKADGTYAAIVKKWFGATAQ